MKQITLENRGLSPVYQAIVYLLTLGFLYISVLFGMHEVHTYVYVHKTTYFCHYTILYIHTGYNEPGYHTKDLAIVKLQKRLQLAIGKQPES